MNREMLALSFLSAAALLVVSGCAGSAENVVESRDTTDASAAASTLAAGYGCDFTMNNVFRKLEDGKYSTQCFFPRGAPPDGVAIVADERDLATNCPVILTTASAPSASPCFPTSTTTQSIVRTNDEMFVNEWRAGKYSLTLRRDVGKYRIIDLTPASAVGGGTPYLIGEDNDATYAVYITNATSFGGLRPKTYRLEVFAKSGVTDPQQCANHAPSSASTVGSCDDVATGGVQTSSSGGGEPPPR